MARGFGATKGAGTTDLITTTYTSTSLSVFSYHIWQAKNGDGGGNFGRHWENTNFFCFPQNASPNQVMNLTSLRSGTTGQWQTVSGDGFPNDNVWRSAGMSYDATNVANDPIMWVSGVKKTVGGGTITEITTPTGTVSASSTVLIGNNVGGTRNFDGALAEFGLWNVILTDDEFIALTKGYSPLLIRPQSLIEYLPMLRSNVSYKLAAPTITGTAIQPHPRIVMPNAPILRKVVAAPAFKAGWSRGSNLPVLGTGTY